MIKKYSLVLVAFLCFVLSGFGQGSESFTNSNAPSNSYGNGSYVGDNGVSWTYVESRAEDGFGITGKGIMLRQSSSNSRVTSSSVANGIGNFTCKLKKAFTGSGNRQIELFVNGISKGTSIAWDNTTVQTFTVNGINVTGNVVIEIRNITGQQVVIDDISWTVASTATVDYCNLQSPATGNTTVGTVYNVYALVREAGITNIAGADPSILGWIGYNTVNNNPNSAGWTWVPATWNAQFNATDDEYFANIGTLPTLPSGTYYYASRFQISGGPYRYGGYDTGGGNGFWDTTLDISGILSVDTPDFVNLQFPGIGTIELGDAFDVYGQVFEQGVTPGVGQGANIEAEVGYRLGGTAATNPNGAGWTWIPGGYNNSCNSPNCNNGQNDEYSANIGVAINVPGTYYYATRFRLNGGIWMYGGILADGSAGSFWNGTTYKNGMLTVNEPPLANVVITEIMYDTSSTFGTDDEWIEICNVSGSSQYLGNYTVRYNGSTQFTFPPATYIANGACITVSLGSNGDNIFNNECPFTPTYGLGAGPPANTNNLANGTVGYTLSLVATNGTSIIDSVTYSSADGGNGNGASLHVTNISLDNSNTSSNWQEVIDGGTAGVNSLISPCTPVAPEIKVEGNVGSFPEIVSGDITPQFLDNTRFAAQFIGSTQSKSYRIRNTGIQPLTVSSVTIGGMEAGDFTVTVPPAAIITPGTFSIMEIEFSPLAAGIRIATVSIINNDSDENPYTFDIRGDGQCVASSNTINPASGSTGTVVTITGTNFAASTTARINGILMPKTVLSSTVLEVIVPAGVTTGNIVIVNSLGCTSNVAFTVIDNQISSCEGNVNLSDLFISEITDATVGGVSYIEIYNGTGAGKPLGGYSIAIYSNGDANPSAIVNLNSVTLANNATYVVAVGISSPSNNTNTCPQAGGNGQLANQIAALGIGGVNKKDNEHDAIRLLKSSGTEVVDEFGVYMNNSWMDATIITGDRGFNFRRLNTAAMLPNPTFNISEWNVIDWVGSGSGSCSSNDYSNIGILDFSRGTPPTVTVQPIVPPLSCDLTTTLSVTATEGFSDGFGLAYQWYVSPPLPAATAWTAITNGGVYSGATTSTLAISNTLNLDNYQYYCQVRENTATCYTASNAVRVKVQKSTWDGMTWSPVAPTIGRIAVLNGNYDMSLFGDNRPSFSACQLLINPTATLTIEDNKFVEVENNVTVDGNVIVRSKGAFVQNNNVALVNGAVLTTPSRIIVEKETSLLNNWYEYTYWSSPVTNATIEIALSSSAPNRRFWYDGSKFLDATKEVGNNNATVDGQDDIDDDGNDWTLASADMLMKPGVGYAATHNSIGFMGPGTRYKYTFEGSFNNGVFTVPIYRNDSVTLDNNWNFIGNPYPSAIFVNDFLSANTALDLNVPGGSITGAIFLWSQNTAPSGTANGNENQNFAQSDYAIINGTAQVAGGDGIMPTRYIPSGQGFFVSMSNTASSTVVSGQIKTANVTFNNAMRVKTNNTQFFRNSAESGDSENKLWLNLTSNNGVFSQIMVGYVAGATDGDDGMYYDAAKNLSSGAYALLYSLIDGNTDLKLGIQGKNPQALTMDEVIPLGFYTSITQATTYTLSVAMLEGMFLTDHSIYLKDDLLGVTHNLSTSAYDFTSSLGEFNNRFEIVFKDQSLSVIENEIPASGLTIIELPNGQVKFIVGNNLNIQNVEIIDMLGRTLYNLKGTSSSEVYELSNLSQAAYMAKVTLSNGQVITKRAVKRK